MILWLVDKRVIDATQGKPVGLDTCEEDSAFKVNGDLFRGAIIRVLAERSMRLRMFTYCWIWVRNCGKQQKIEVSDFESELYVIISYMAMRWPMSVLHRSKLKKFRYCHNNSRIFHVCLQTSLWHDVLFLSCHHLGDTMQLS